MWTIEKKKRSVRLGLASTKPLVLKLVENMNSYLWPRNVAMQHLISMLIPVSFACSFLIIIS